MNTEIGKAIFEIEEQKSKCQKAILEALKVFKENTGLNPIIELPIQETFSGTIVGVKIRVQI